MVKCQHHAEYCVLFQTIQYILAGLQATQVLARIAAWPYFEWSLLRVMEGDRDKQSILKIIAKATYEAPVVKREASFPETMPWKSLLLYLLRMNE